MNTNRRGKKRNDIVDKVKGVWNERLSELIEKNYRSRKAFVEAYKEKYGIGNTADASRWVNVGSRAAKDEIIGFPSYDTMRRIADFLGVTVGYLTGETDYESFEMERACKYFGVDQATGEAILRITKSNGLSRFDRFLKINTGKALCQLITAKSFEECLCGICQYAEAAYNQAYPVDHMNSPKIQAIKPEILDLAIKYSGMHYEVGEDLPEELTDEVIDAILAIDEADGKNFSQQYGLEQNVKLAKFELQEHFFHLIEEVLRRENWEELRGHFFEAYSSTAELKKRMDEVLKDDNDSNC